MKEVHVYRGYEHFILVAKDKTEKDKSKSRKQNSRKRNSVKENL